jgi:uncharacterized membrane protein HdeD (DUF308 family)
VPQTMHEPADMLGRLGRHWGWLFAYGLLTLIAGLAVLVWPSETLLVIAVLFGIQLIIFGIFRFVMAFAVDDLTGERACSTHCLACSRSSSAYGRSATCC